ncbi:hypothetical protein ACFE04_003192 [Oxalis oulophora]
MDRVMLSNIQQLHSIYEEIECWRRREESAIANVNQLEDILANLGEFREIEVNEEETIQTLIDEARLEVQRCRNSKIHHQQQISSLRSGYTHFKIYDYDDVINFYHVYVGSTDNPPVSIPILVNTYFWKLRYTGATLAWL